MEVVNTLSPLVSIVHVPHYSQAQRIRVHKLHRQPITESNINPIAAH